MQSSRSRPASRNQLAAGTRGGVATPAPATAGTEPGSGAPVSGPVVLGCVRAVDRAPTPLAAGRALKIGVLLREQDLEAAPMRNSATLAAEEWNDLGGVLGQHRIEVAFYDEGATPETGLAAVKRALADGIDMLVGGRSPTAGPSYVEAVMDAGRFLFLTTIGPSDAPKKWVTAWDRYKTYFHMDPVAGFQFEPSPSRSFTPKVTEHFLAVETGALLAYIKQTWGFDRIAFVSEDEPLFQKMVGVFGQAAKSRGWTVTSADVVGPKTDFTALWTKLRASKTQFVRFVLRDGVSFARAYGQVKPPILAFGNLDGSTTKGFWKQTDGGARGMIFHHKGAADVPVIPLELVAGAYTEARPRLRPRSRDVTSRSRVARAATPRRRSSPSALRDVEARVPVGPALRLVPAQIGAVTSAARTARAGVVLAVAAGASSARWKEALQGSVGLPLAHRYGPSKHRAKQRHQALARGTAPARDADHLVPLAEGWSILEVGSAPQRGVPIGELVTRARPRSSTRSIGCGSPGRAVGALQAARDALGPSCRRSATRRRAPAMFNRAFEASGRGKPFVAGSLPAPLVGSLERLRDAQQACELTAATLAPAYETAAATADEHLLAIAASPRFREAIAWQNRGFLDDLDRLVGTPEGAQRRRVIRTLLMYAQRYYTKCDTIGFFGPIGWGQITTGREPFALRIGELLARRTVYFEHWAIAEVGHALAAAYPEAHRWFAPRRAPMRDVQATLSATEQAVIEACDGERTAVEIAGVLAEDPEVILAILTGLRERSQILWTLETAVGTPWPERDLRARIGRVADAGLRSTMLDRLSAIERKRDDIAAAAGSADDVVRTIDALNAEFVAVTGHAAVRRGGQTYAGRTLVYEDCVRDVGLEIEPTWLASLAAPLGLLAQSARWFTHRVSVGYMGLLQGLHAELRQDHGPSIPFPVLWAAYKPHGRSEPSLRAKGGVPRIIDATVAGLRARWAEVLALPDADVSRVDRTAAELAPRIAAQFAAPHSGIPLFRYHSPDLMLAAESADALARGELLGVLGEIHTGNNTISPVFLKEHAERDRLVAARSFDLPRTDVYPVFPRDFQTRATFVSFKPHDVMLELGDAVRDWPREGVFHPADLRVEEHAGELVARCVRTDRRFGLPALFSYFLLATSTDHYAIAPERAHVPRVTIDRLVIVRETWRFTRDQLPWARARVPAQRYAELQRWRHDHGLPRFVFVKSPLEKKPFFSDLYHPGLVEILARHAGRAEALELTEMLPGPTQCWLPDREGRRYVSELRMVLRDASEGLGSGAGSGAGSVD